MEPATAPSTATATAPLLDVRELRTTFATDDGLVRAVDGVSLAVQPGQTLAVVGESGSGKSVTGLSIMGLIPNPPGRIVGGEILFRRRDGKTLDLTKVPRRDLLRLRGKEISMIFQEPMTSLNPVFTIGSQIVESVRLHLGKSASEARAHARRMLELVEIPAAERRLDEYPHQLSGGMRQRAMIALALANTPSLLIADEPTTALDVTIQAQILELLRTLQQETGMAILLITHDLGVVAENADVVAVMYAGRVAEVASVDDIFYNPRHPYTRGLLDSLPTLEGDGGRLRPIPGAPPSMVSPPPACAFHPRCPRAEAICSEEQPGFHVLGGGQVSACHFAEELGAGERAVQP